jgi:hypothetical protein
VHSERSGHLAEPSTQVGRSGSPGGPLLIRGFGVQVPGGAPVLSWAYSSPHTQPDDDRVRKVSADIAAAMDRGRNCLVLTQWVTHLDRLAEALRTSGHDPVMLRGMGARARAAALERLQPQPAAPTWTCRHARGVRAARPTNCSRCMCWSASCTGCRSRRTVTCSSSKAECCCQSSFLICPASSASTSGPRRRCSEPNELPQCGSSKTCPFQIRSLR